MGHGSPWLVAVHSLEQRMYNPQTGEGSQSNLQCPSSAKCFCLQLWKKLLFDGNLGQLGDNGMITLWPNLTRAGKVAEKAAKKVPFFETQTGTIWTRKTSPRYALGCVIINHRQHQTFMFLPEIFLVFHGSQFIHLSHSILSWLWNINFETNLYSSSGVYFSSIHVPFSPANTLGASFSQLGHNHG